MWAKRNIALCCGLLWLCTTPLPAALEVIPGAGGFSGDSVQFDFSGLVTGSNAQHALAKWGITFESTADSVPRVGVFAQLSFVNTYVVNQPVSEGSPDRPLAILFRHPARKVGFFLRDTGASVTVRAFDVTGRDLGSVVLNTAGADGAHAVETTDPAGISKLVIAYDPPTIMLPEGPFPPTVEKLDDLKVEFLQRPQFSIYFAQIGDGPIPGIGKFQTSFVVTNLSGSTATGEIRFFNSLGNPLQVSNGAVTAHTFPINLPARGSYSFATPGTANPIAVGYARVTSNVPIDGTAIFRVLNPAGGLISEAGVGAAEGRYVSVGAVQKVLQGNFDSGIAVVNTGTAAANGFIELLNEAGQVVGTNAEVAQLAAGAHTAKFLSDMFGNLAAQNFAGTVRVVSDQPLAVVILRTSSGLVQSSLPVGSLE